nr:hypothetical protein BaRGS_025171 [Batillaria attramentaria]
MPRRHGSYSSEVSQRQNQRRKPITMTTLVQTAPVQITNIHDTENVPPTFTRRDVMKHCDSDSCWIIVEDKVYDVTRFLRQHPGGDDIILEYAGHDASAAFWDKGHSNDAHRMLREYYIGDLKEIVRGLELDHQG